jgi:hypothetical protein
VRVQLDVPAGQRTYADHEMLHRSIWNLVW